MLTVTRILDDIFLLTLVMTWKSYREAAGASWTLQQWPSPILLTGCSALPGVVHTDQMNRPYLLKKKGRAS